MKLIELYEKQGVSKERVLIKLSSTWEGIQVIFNSKEVQLSCLCPSLSTSPQIFLMCWLNNFEDFYWVLIGWFIKFSVQTFQPIILIYRRGNFKYHKGCTLIYRPLSYPFRSMVLLNYLSLKHAIRWSEIFLNCPLFLYN